MRTLPLGGDNPGDKGGGKPVTRGVARGVTAWVTTTLRNLFRRRTAGSAAAILAAAGAEDFDPRGFVVYCLWDAHGDVVYVGESCNVFARVGDHLSNRGRADLIPRVSVIRCRSERSMHLTEAWLIDRLQPILNIMGTADQDARLAERLRPAPPREQIIPPSTVLIDPPTSAPADEFVSPDAPQPSAEQAMRLVEQRIEHWREADRREFYTVALADLLAEVNRSRAWLYWALGKLAARGVIDEDMDDEGRRRWLIRQTEGTRS